MPEDDGQLLPDIFDVGGSQGGIMWDGVKAGPKKVPPSRKGFAGLDPKEPEDEPQEPNDGRVLRR